MAKYKQRISDRILKRKVLGKGAVLIEGPKWCGKTTTAEEFAESKAASGSAAPVNNYQASPAPSPSSDIGDGFMNIPDGIDEELPF